MDSVTLKNILGIIFFFFSSFTLDSN
jgi:hypothetical protein